MKDLRNGGKLDPNGRGSSPRSPALSVIEGFRMACLVKCQQAPGGYGRQLGL